MVQDDYLETLKTRRKESHVYKSFQLDGLEIAQMLNDQAHKALYIKLARDYDSHALRVLAKSIVENKNVKKKGAYFMAVFTRDRMKFKRGNGPKDISTRQPRRRRGSARKNNAV